MTDDPGLLLSARLAQLQVQLDTAGARIASLKDGYAVLQAIWVTELNRIDERLAALERPTPVPTPSPVPSLPVDFTASIAGDAIVSTTDAELSEMLDRLKDLGCKIVRILHTGKDDRVWPSNYQPTMAEWRAGFPYIDRIVRMCKERGMLIWLTLHHRQRLTEQEARDLGVYETLFEKPRPAGIHKGEINDLFLIFPTLEKFVGDYCTELASRYKDEPTVALITVANEKLGTRVRGTWPDVSERNRPDISAHIKAWFARLDQYQAKFNVSDTNLKHAHEWSGRFGAWNGYTVYSRLKQRLRDSGVKCPIGTSCIFGDSKMNALAELTAGDFIDLHIYPTSTPTLPDPFLPNVVRTVRTAANALRVEGMPLFCGEYAGVNEGAQQKLDSWLTAPMEVAQAGFDLSCFYCSWLGKIGNGTVWNGFDDFELVERFKQARPIGLNPPRAEHTYVLTPEELYGTRVRISEGNWKDVAPVIPGTQEWAQEGIVNVKLPELGF